MKGRHVGVFWRSSEDARPDMVAACRHAVALLEEHGCEVGPAAYIEGLGFRVPGAPRGRVLALEDARPDVVAACRHAVALLEEHGCEVGLAAYIQGFLGQVD